MNPDITIRAIRHGEEETVCGVVKRSFDLHVGQEYSPEGVAEFYRYANSVAMASRLTADHFVLVAEHQNHLVGMIEFRNNQHLSMLFVDPPYFRKGVSRSLFGQALGIIMRANPGADRITVNSSRYAVPVYQSFGFITSGPERTINGIIFIPMHFFFRLSCWLVGRDSRRDAFGRPPALPLNSDVSQQRREGRNP